MHKHKKEQTQVVKSIIVILVSLLFIACSVKKQEDKGTYDIEVFKSKNKTFRYITMKSFHYGGKEKFPASYRVNNVILDNELSHEKTISVLEGEFKIESIFPGKLNNLVTLKVKKGDSIVIKFYLKDDPTPLHAPEYVPEKKKNK